jgi:hypothetical protein
VSEGDRKRPIGIDREMREVKRGIAEMGIVREEYGPRERCLT